MRDASTRVLLDRTVIRLDGRPFFSFGPRIFLTPRDRIPAAISDIAAAGFNCVATPPASRGNRDVIDEIFYQAQQHGLLVIVMAEPRVPDPASFLAEHYRHRANLHSYCLPTRDATAEALAWFCAERDRLRAKDLFHPIWTPYQHGMPVRQWLEAVDLQSVGQALGGPFPRSDKENGSKLLAQFIDESARTRLSGRPLFCHSFETSVPDAARQAGLYSVDPAVRRLPERVADWYPYAADLEETRRRDFLPPDPELLRLRLFELLASRVRGIITDYFDFLQGPSPFSGRDRFAELARIAQEIIVCGDFLAEGQRVTWELETGHPRFRASVLRHADDYLMLVWHSAPGDEFWIDPAGDNKLEIILQIDPQTTFEAWQIDFPNARRLPVDYDLKGAMRVQLDSVDLTAKVLLTRSPKRISEISNRIRERRGPAARFLADELRYRVEKITFVESELDELGIDNGHATVTTDCRRQLDRTITLLENEKYDLYWREATLLLQALRGLIARRMAVALNAAPLEDRATADLLRHSYYTLPLYYREIDLRDSRAILEFT